jgi:hypothetical protein
VITATLVQQLVTVLMSSMQVRFVPFLCTVLHAQAHCTMHIECASWLAHRLRWRCWDCQMETSHHRPKLQLQSWQTASSSCWQSTQSLQLLQPRLQVTMLQPGMVWYWSDQRPAHTCSLLTKAYHCRFRCFWHGTATDGSRGLPADALHGSAAERTSRRAAEPAPQFAPEHRQRCARAPRPFLHAAAPRHAAGAGSVCRHIGAGRSCCCARGARRRQDTAWRSLCQASASGRCLAGAQCCWLGAVLASCVRWHSIPPLHAGRMYVQQALLWQHQSH